jgi:hypothetical protein
LNVARQSSFARVGTNKKSIAARGWGSPTYILLEHPELQDTNDRVKLINEMYDKQVRDGVEITNLATLNT